MSVKDKLIFEKKGKICSSGTLDLDWYKKNSMVPVPYILNDKIIRIFFTMCDNENVGRIGYIDVDIENPGKILGYSKKPLIDIGPDGTYDDNGVVTSSLFLENNRLYLFYSGYELCVKVPYRIMCGVAVSDDNGQTFVKHSRAALLPAIDDELYNRCAPYVMQGKNGGYQLFYLGDSDKKWVMDVRGKMVPVYTMKTVWSENLLNYPLHSGEVVMPFLNDDECGITLPNIWKDNGKYKMIYSIRSVKSGYKLGYAESIDGVHFKRMDDRLEFVGGENSDWDNEMMCFGQVLHTKQGTYIFYSGNHYGMGGIGYLELKGQKR